jgi:predicted lysophospholipase L1 biosynthesis ABC-type transport system permease subunit
VADPLNLNAFKAQMDDIGRMSAIPTANESPKGESVRVRDETFIKTAENLKNNLAGLYTFLPIVFAVVALVGYAIAYLLMQSRRRDIVLMRSLGVGRAACITVMLLEFTALSLAGSLLGLAVSALLIGFANADTPLMAMLFFASLLLGIAVASVQLSGVNLMTGLNKTEE